MIKTNMSLYALAALIVFLMTACGDDKKSEQTYYGSNALVIANEQVWLRNYSTNKVSQAHEKYNGKDYDVTVFNEYVEEIGSGTIYGGKLSFTVTVPGNLLEWEKLKRNFGNTTEGEGWDVEIDKNTTKGTFILLVTDEDKYQLFKEGLSGTSSSVSDEAVYFIYVDTDCTITGNSKEDTRVMYTFNPFTLKLKAGWNTLWYKQTYTSSGMSSFFMDIKNPDLKWVLISTVPTR
jgi:hypothetical protein